MEIDSFNLAQTYFEVFNLDVQSQPDRNELRATYMALQRQYHPDKFAAADDQQRRKAVQVAAFINQAHQTLSDPLKCAEYCLKLQGVDVDSEADAKMDPMFLMEQMEWREALEDISDDDPGALTDLEKLRVEIAGKITAIGKVTASQLEAAETTTARNSVRKWQFLSKLNLEAEALEARLDDLNG